MTEAKIISVSDSNLEPDFIEETIPTQPTRRSCQRKSAKVILERNKLRSIYHNKENEKTDKSFKWIDQKHVVHRVNSNRVLVQKTEDLLGKYEQDQ